MADLLEHGPREGGPPRRRRAVVVVAVVAAVAVLAAIVGYRVTRPAAAPVAHPSRTPVPVSTPTRVGSGASMLPGAERSWRLYARVDAGGGDHGEVAALEPGTGYVRRTPVPGLLSSGPVFFVVGRAGVLVRPLDEVAGYGVPPDGPAYRLHGLLARGGPVFPGPRAGWLWVPGTGRHGEHELILLGPGYAPTGPRVRLPGGVQSAVTDGAGGLLYSTADGLVDADPAGRRRHLTGTLLATGGPGWLLRRCHHRGHGVRCRLAYVDRKKGHRRDLGPLRSPRLPAGLVPIGTVSPAPDGRTAALLSDLDGTPSTLHLIDLHTGVVHDSGVTVDRDELWGSRLAWSPDGRWLFAVTDDGRIVAVDRASAHPRRLAPFLPPVRQIAFRDLAAS